MNEQEKQIAFESIARELKKSSPDDCGAVTAETVAAVQAWTETPAEMTACEEMVRDMLRADSLLQTPQSAAELLHRAERTEI